jgi:hypothetical protein
MTEEERKRKGFYRKLDFYMGKAVGENKNGF